VNVFRCALDDRPGMLVIDLGDGILAAWDTREGLLYKVWSGDVAFTGTVYDTRHGPRPSARGTLLFAARPTTRESEVLSTRPAVPPEIIALGAPADRRWLGHRLEPGRVVLLVTGNTGETRISISRNPSAAEFPVLVSSN
jgi:cytochrome c